MRCEGSELDEIRINGMDLDIQDGSFMGCY